MIRVFSVGLLFSIGFLSIGFQWIFVIAWFLHPSPLCAKELGLANSAEEIAIGSSGLPLPRFASLKSARVNVRVGPDQNKYAIAWTYHRRGLPVEIIQEYDNWRRIRDSDGDTGWVMLPLLSGKRTVIIKPWHKKKDNFLTVRQNPVLDAAIIAQAESGVIGQIHFCDGRWCELTMNRNIGAGQIWSYVRGWIEQDQLWGVYPGEKVSE